MAQLPRTWEPKKGAGDTEVRKTSRDVVEAQPAKKVEKEEEEGEDEKPSCCRQVGLSKMTAKQLDSWKGGLLAAQPKLTAKDIRRYRFKHHVVICLELEEEGLPESAAYIRHLLQLNVEMRRAAGPDTFLWQKPKLRDSKEYLDQLRAGLGEAERAQQEGKLPDQCAALVSLAVFFMTRDEAWWWVAEQLFLWIVTVAEQIKADGGRLEAITRYIFGLFLLTQLEDVNEARRQLQQARVLSDGKDWDACNELGRPQESVFRETCGLLYKALLLAAQEIREENPTEAIRLCCSALRRAQDSQRKENEAEALYELSLSYQFAGRNDKSLEILDQFLEVCTELCDAQRLCNAHLEIAICYKNLQDEAATFKHLEMFLQIADENYLTERKAEANRYLGEYHLNMGNYCRANTHFGTSLSLYFKMSMAEETEQVRCLQGIAAGHEMLPAFTRLLIDADGNSRDMARLIQWKSLHVPFWVPTEVPFIREDDDDFVETPPGSPQEGGSISGELSQGSNELSATSNAPSTDIEGTPPYSAKSTAANEGE